MIKFSVSHSSILETAGELSQKLEHTLHLDKIARLLAGAGAEIIQITRINVVARITEEKFANIFDIAADQLESYYGSVVSPNSVIGRFIDHLEHHPVNSPGYGEDIMS